ncbi:MAG TPA: ammonia-forming cytochrome c nitrite reductase subunit c552 [Candidatus Polarisedimenticolia bacterium]|nr:ammonia-forming cytochrome c nitrite reductase subunit c552 [Candidatus Polarisedimenticolia bacterium]
MPCTRGSGNAGRPSRPSRTRTLLPAVLACLVLSCRSHENAHPAGPAATYVGAERCATCHQEETARWKLSAHGNHAFTTRPEVVKGDFELKNVYVYRGVTSRMSVKDGKYSMLTEGPSGNPETYPVDIVLGFRQTQVYLTRFPDGRYQVLPTYYDLEEQLWYDQTEGVVPSGGKKLTPKDHSFWANRGRTWNSGCSGCHGSQVEKNFDLASATYKTSWVDLTINCESCHGPGSLHVEAWSGASRGGDIDAARGGLIKLGELSPKRQVEVCAKCHAAKTTLQRGYKPGEDFLDYYEPIVPSTGNQFFSDGRNKGLNYNYIAHLQSSCYAKGDLTCTGCHDPHGSENPVDLREPQSNLPRLCIHCHADKKLGPEEHSHHDAAAVNCMDCHMPFVDILGRRLQARDHSISVPVPAVTQNFGAPNACNTCHRDRDPEWAAQAIKRWFKDEQTDRVNKAAAFFYGFRKDPAAPRALLSLFSDKSALSMPRRAGIPRILATYQDPSILTPLVDAMLDPQEEPLVRYQIVAAFASVPGPESDQALLRAVSRPENAMRRVAGVELARRGVRPKDPALQQRIQDVVKDYEEVVGDVRSDVPEDHAGLGDIYAKRGETDKALSEYRFALKLDPDLPQIRIQMGTALAERGEIDSAAEQFNAAAALLPSSPVPPFNLGVLYQQAKRPAEAIPHFTRALEIDPGHAEAQYFLALARLDTGEPRAAVELLTKFLSSHPRNAMAHFQLGRAYEAAGDRRGARDEYSRAVSIAPNLAEARTALGKLGS